MRDRLEEYVDGLLSAEQCKEVEAALAADVSLRDELHRVRRFAEVVQGLGPAAAGDDEVRRIVGRARMRQRRRGWIVRLAVASAAAAASWLLLSLLTAPDPHTARVTAEIELAWRDFGKRLGVIAAERRAGRVPRTGIGDLEVPPATASGIVFQGALDELGIPLPDAAAEDVKDAVAAHFVAMRRTGRHLAAEYERAESSLALYRRLDDLAGEAVADAYYDVFRPALANLETTRRVSPGTLRFVLQAQLEPALAARYLNAYMEAVARLNRAYGEPRVALVLSRLAPDDRRSYWQDASQDGVPRNVVLAIRARLYRAAYETGVDKLYVDIES